MRGRAPLAAAMAAVCAVMAARGDLGDYEGELLPTMEALLDGDFGELASGGHLMGPLSILLRLPVVALVDALGGGDLLAYRVGAFVCLLPAAALGIYLREQIAARGAHPLAAVGVALLCVVNPAVDRALEFGHPEEVLTAALCVGAVLAVRAERLPLGVGLLVAALLSKQWALLAAPVVLVAAGARWRRALAYTAAVAVALALPVIAADPGQFARTTERLAAVTDEGVESWGTVLPQSAWWPLAATNSVTVFDGVENVTVDRRRLEDPVKRLARPILGLVVLALALVAARRGRPDVLALLAAVFLLRCVLDPANGLYYHVPFMLALLAWDSHERTWPVSGLLAWSLLWITFERIQPIRDFALTNAVYLAWTLPLAAWLTVAATRRRAAPSRTA